MHSPRRAVLLVTGLHQRLWPAQLLVLAHTVRHHPSLSHVQALGAQGPQATPTAGRARRLLLVRPRVLSIGVHIRRWVWQVGGRGGELCGRGRVLLEEVVRVGEGGGSPCDNALELCAVDEYTVNSAVIK